MRQIVAVRPGAAVFLEILEASRPASDLLLTVQHDNIQLPEACPAVKDGLGGLWRTL